MFAFFRSLWRLVFDREHPRRYPSERFKDGRRYAIALAPYLRDFSATEKKPMALSPFSVMLWHGWGWERTEHVFRDEPFGFLLRYNRTPIAGIGFALKERAVIIGQIQGVQGCARELRMLRWERMLVAIVVDWARAHGFLIIKIRRAEHNGYYFKENPRRDLDKREIARNASLKRRYNGTARACGFHPDPSDPTMLVRSIAP